MGEHTNIYYWAVGSASAGLAIAALFLKFIKDYIYSIDKGEALEERVDRLEQKQDRDRSEILNMLERIEDKLDRLKN